MAINAGSSNLEGSNGTLKNKIARHPHYHRVVAAHIECLAMLYKEIGAPPEKVAELDPISRECKNRRRCLSAVNKGEDPATDKFMEFYFQKLLKFRLEITKKFNQMRTFLNDIEVELNLLTNGSMAGEVNKIGILGNSGSLKTNIAGHPRFGLLVRAHIDCLKMLYDEIGAPPEKFKGLDQIIHEYNHGRYMGQYSTTIDIGDDRKFDKVMSGYYKTLNKFRVELAKKFCEMKTFLHEIKAKVNPSTTGTAAGLLENFQLLVKIFTNIYTENNIINI